MIFRGIFSKNSSVFQNITKSRTSKCLPIYINSFIFHHQRLTHFNKYPSKQTLLLHFLTSGPLTITITLSLFLSSQPNLHFQQPSYPTATHLSHEPIYTHTTCIHIPHPAHLSYLIHTRTISHTLHITLYTLIHVRTAPFTLEKTRRTKTYLRFRRVQRTSFLARCSFVCPLEGSEITCRGAAFFRRLGNGERRRENKGTRRSSGISARRRVFYKWRGYRWIIARWNYYIRGDWGC